MGVATPAANRPPHPAPAQVGEPAGLIPTVRVFIHPDDIYPGAVVLKPGKFRLLVENETVGDVALVVEQVSPGQSRQPVATVRTINQGKRARQEMALVAGEYVYYEASRPQQQGRLIINSKDR